MKRFNCNKLSLGHKLKKLLFSAALGLLILFAFAEKSYNIQLDAIAISPDEQYIACFETGDGYKIRCYHTNGLPAFVFDVPIQFSSGGHCTLWFEDDVLCVLFYRTDIVILLDMDGTILAVNDGTHEEPPPEFSSFLRKGGYYTFDGNEIDVVYNKGSFVGYWFLGEKRCLSITSAIGIEKIIWVATAIDGVMSNTD